MGSETNDEQELEASDLLPLKPAKAALYKRVMGKGAYFLGAILSFAMFIGLLYERGEYLRLVAEHSKCVKQSAAVPAMLAEATKATIPVVTPAPPASVGTKAVLIDTEFSAKKVEAVRGRLATTVDACRHMVPKLQLCIKPVRGGKQYAALATAGSGLTETDAAAAHQCLVGYIPDAMVKYVGKYQYPGCI